VPSILSIRVRVGEKMSQPFFSDRGTGKVQVMKNRKFLVLVEYGNIVVCYLSICIAIQNSKNKKSKRTDCCSLVLFFNDISR